MNWSTADLESASDSLAEARRSIFEDLVVNAPRTLSKKIPLEQIRLSTKSLVQDDQACKVAAPGPEEEEAHYKPTAQHTKIKTEPGSSTPMTAQLHGNETVNGIEQTAIGPRIVIDKLNIKDHSRSIQYETEKGQNLQKISEVVASRAATQRPS